MTLAAFRIRPVASRITSGTHGFQSMARKSSRGSCHDGPTGEAGAHQSRLLCHAVPEVPKHQMDVVRVQVEEACEIIASKRELQGGYNAVGFSQGMPPAHSPVAVEFVRQTG